jgi:hypothetical protein
MAAVDARPASRQSSRQQSMSSPPPVPGRPSQAGRVGLHHPSQFEVGRVPSHHSPQTGRGPSAAQQGGFSDRDFVKVGRAPSHAADFVEPHLPSRHPSDILPNHRLNLSAQPTLVPRPPDHPQDLSGLHVLLQPQPRPQQVDQLPQQFGLRLQQHHGQRPVIDTSIYHGQVGASGQRWQGIVRKWDNYMAGDGYQ